MTTLLSGRVSEISSLFICYFSIFIRTASKVFSIYIDLIDKLAMTFHKNLLKFDKFYRNLNQAEAVVRRCSSKWVFLEILQISQEA